MYYDWIIAVCSTEADGISIYSFRGSVEEAKQKIVELVDEDYGKDHDAWVSGTELPEEVEEVFSSMYELYGYGSYENYHIDYVAKEIAHIPKI